MQENLPILNMRQNPRVQKKFPQIVIVQSIELRKNIAISASHLHFQLWRDGKQQQKRFSVCFFKIFFYDR